MKKLLICLLALLCLTPAALADWGNMETADDIRAACMEAMGEEWMICTDETGKPLFTFSGDEAIAFMTDGPRTRLCFFQKEYGRWYDAWSTDEPLFGMSGLTPASLGLTEEDGVMLLHCLLEGENYAYAVTAQKDYYPGNGNWYVTKQTRLVPADGWGTADSWVYLTKYHDTPPLLDYFTLLDTVQEPVLIEGNTLLLYPESRTDAHYVVPDGIEIISPDAFSGNPALVRVTLPESVRVIGDGAFAYCHNLRVVDMPTSLDFIGPSAFECSYVQQVNIPNGLTELPEWVFCAADLRGTLVIPEGITDIGEECFAFNANLTDMYLPASLTTMGGETAEEGWGFDGIYCFNHIDPGQEHMTVHAPAGTEAARFAERSGYPYVIEDARGGTGLPAMTALVQSALDKCLPGALVCENEYGFPCVSYSAETVFAFARREGSGWVDEWFLCCFDRAGSELTLRFVNDALYGREWPQFWPERLVPLDMKLIGDRFTLTLQVGEETVLDLIFTGESWNLSHASTSIWYEPGDGGPNYWQTQLMLPITGGVPLWEFSTVHYTYEE